MQVECVLSASFKRWSLKEEEEAFTETVNRVPLQTALTEGTAMAKALLGLYTHHLCRHGQHAFLLLRLPLRTVSSSHVLGSKEREMPQPMSIEHFREMVSSSRFWS